MVINFPMMSKRDAVIQMQTFECGEDMLIVSSSVKHKDYPEKEGIYRMVTVKASRIKNTADGVEGTDFNNSDLKGYFPTRLLNLAMGSAVSKGMG